MADFLKKKQDLRGILLPHHNVVDHRFCEAIVHLHQQFSLGVPINLATAPISS
ncbi:MAG: hypothetical protein J6Y35_04800 [Bacteroidales bacterium]|nr:hypothetical protein [Bacteroidales bacterium]